MEEIIKLINKKNTDTNNNIETIVLWLGDSGDLSFGEKI